MSRAKRHATEEERALFEAVAAGRKLELNAAK